MKLQKQDNWSVLKIYTALSVPTYPGSSFTTYQANAEQPETPAMSVGVPVETQSTQLDTINRIHHIPCALE